jgi:hypothetical protein
VRAIGSGRGGGARVGTGGREVAGGFGNWGIGVRRERGGGSVYVGGGWPFVFGRSGTVPSVGFEENGRFRLVSVRGTRIVGVDPWAGFPAF